MNSQDWLVHFRFSHGDSRRRWNAVSCPRPSGRIARTLLTSRSVSERRMAVFSHWKRFHRNTYKSTLAKRTSSNACLPCAQQAGARADSFARPIAAMQRFCTGVRKYSRCSTIRRCRRNEIEECMRSAGSRTHCTYRAARQGAREFRCVAISGRRVLKYRGPHQVSSHWNGNARCGGSVHLRSSGRVSG